MPRLRFALPSILPLFAAFSVVTVCLPAVGSDSAAPAQNWPVPLTREAKPWTRWWWLGSAVDKATLTRELEAFAAAGFGGVEITPIYGAKGFEEQFISYLSPQYLEMLTHTTAEAHRLGLGVDMATGTGWPFGGKHVRREDAELRLRLKDDAIASEPTQFRVKRAAPGGEGWVLNPFSPEAMTRYLAPFTEALNRLPAGALRAQFHDSFEYTANWSQELPAKFLQHHRYLLDNHAGALAEGGDDDQRARIKSDYRATLNELHLETMRVWTTWAHGRGQRVRNQAHGAPANLLDLYALADIPETEVFGANRFDIPGFRYDPASVSRNEPQPLVNRFASSAAHVAGRPLVSSETFTWLREHFHEAPSQMKPELDQLFLAGINHVFYHGTAYSSPEAPWPGWLFYASSQINERNPLWPAFSSMNAYVGRAQALLQLGQPDNDFLLYWPIHDLWHTAKGWNRNFSMHGKDWLTGSSTGAVADELLNAGYSFDFVSDAQLQETSFPTERLQTRGARYRGIVVPPTRLMPPATLRRLLELAERGATVVFAGELPVDVPGFSRLEERRAEFHRLLSTLTWSDTPVGRESSVGRGRLIAGKTLKPLLATTGIAAESSVTRGLHLLRRQVDGAPLYFIANLGAEAFDGWAAFTQGANFATLLDARTGRQGSPALRRGEGATEVYLQLAPGESIFLLFKAAPRVEAPTWTYVRPGNAASVPTFSWQVRFLQGGPQLPPPFAATTLASWTEQGGAAENFAGTAVYETTFTLPENADADDWLLELGDVREAARVFVNGTEVDTLWSLPFRVCIGAQLKPGENQLRLEVTNLAANRIRWMDAEKLSWKNFHEINFVNVHYEPLDAALWKVQPAGLLGPVALRPLQTFRPE